MLPQKEVEGIIPTIQAITLENLKLQSQIAEKEDELRNLYINVEIQDLKNLLKSNEAMETELREKGKNMMIENWLKEFEMLDGTIVQINKTPGALIIEEGATFDEKYYRVKKEIDKTAIKKDFNAGIPLEGCYIQSEYRFIIKSK